MALSWVPIGNNPLLYTDDQGNGPAGPHILKVMPVDASGSSASSSALLELTPVLDTNAYANNDVLFIPTEITNAVRESGGRIYLHSAQLLDEDHAAAAAVAIDLIFFNASASLGTINQPVTITDADARKIVGVVHVLVADYTELVNSAVATKATVGLEMAPNASTSLYVGAVLRSGTPTFTASGIKLKFGVLWD